MQRAKTWHGFSWKRRPITSRLLLLPKPLKRNWLHMLIESPYTRGECFVNHHHPWHRFQNQEEKNIDFKLLHVSGETFPCIDINDQKLKLFFFFFLIYFCSFIYLLIYLALSTDLVVAVSYFICLFS